MESKGRILILVIFIIFNIIVFSQTLLEKAEVYYFNGKSSFQSGEYKSAERYFEEALSLTAEIEIKYPDIRYMLGWTKFYLKKYTEAEKYLKYYPNDEKVQLALRSIKSGNIEEDLHFKNVTLNTKEATKTQEEKIKIPITAYIIASAVILFIILLLVGLSYFFVFRKYSLGAKGQKAEEKIETIEEVEMEEEVIPVEEILEVKVDELEELWQEYEKMKQKMDIDEEEIANESILDKPKQEDSNPPSPPPAVPQEMDNMEGNLEELDIDNLLEEEESAQDSGDETIIEEEAEEKNIDIEDLIEDNTEEKEEVVENIVQEEISENESSSTIDEVIEKDKVKNLDEIDTVKPHMEVVAKYNKIMKEPVGAIVASNVKGIESLEDLDKEVSNKGGVYSKGDLHTIFKEIFAERNRDELMIE